ncbi:MAG TPA: dockerin type I domain-containing protein [Candidatus Binatia bacterium]|jgi:hypothetical protein
MRSRTKLPIWLSAAFVIASASAGWANCGDPSHDGQVTADDALIVLRASIGIGHCIRSECDIDGSGKVTASDALAVLKLAVGEDVTINCPSSTTTVPSST